MENDNLREHYPISVKCNGSDAVVFVSCPRGGRFGDVRKTLAGLLQRPFHTINIAPHSPEYVINRPIEPYDSAELVPEDRYGTIIEASTLKLNDAGEWVLE
ncbi:hypothetical protein AGDE_04243 [Angomonas deanei]|uniref:Uncharacterized protein n=1 Tax=Angomonas deanei TaxID=59799 RepID=A0A7G2CEM1_9TRYP|nr:hypothetical protein AGDE_04243 [Angomonas deanei]CAD2217959.1 hypothetical protein, conserved [Angomonas deanei]|eukprot:EPY39685.1 hypothetical protein AGDE_04243 [Angomonas deanei]